MSEQKYRGDGTTTRQMQQAPQGAVYVWCNRHTDYAEKLKRKLGRDDLKIVDAGWITDMRWAGMPLTGIVVDHATTFTQQEYDTLQRMHTRVRPAPSGRDCL